MSVKLLSRLLAVVFFPFSIANAATIGDDPVITVEKENYYYKVEVDGNYTDVSEFQYLLNEERATKDNGQEYIYLNKQLDKLVSIEAYTIKADGRKIKVKEENIKTQSDPVSGNAPKFNDIEYKVVVFPDLAVGDRTYIKYSRKRQPMFPGYFNIMNAPGFNPYKESIVTYDLPESMTLKSLARGYNPVPVKTATGRKVYEWRYGLTPKNRVEADAVSYLDYGDQVQVSTFKDYAELAQAYEKNADGKAKPNQQIRDLAIALTKNTKSDREKALILSAWVRKNIRYVALYLGRGGVVPHSADEVLSNRYGDCKDHTTLLEAMLAAVDIESTTALINSGDRYTLPEVPLTSAFNHAITYVPSLEMYTDTTTPQIGAGYLPPSLLGKPVLLTKTGKLSQTPVTQLGEAVTQFSYVIQADGVVSLDATQTLYGWGAEFNRYQLNNMPKEYETTLVTRLLARNNLRGEGVIALGKEQENPDQQSVLWNSKIDNYINLTGTAGVPIVSSLAGGLTDVITYYGLEKTRTQPFKCGASKVTEETTYTIPANAKVISIPKGIALEDTFFKYSSSYQKTDEGFKALRHLEAKSLGSAVCSVEDFKAMQNVLNQIMRDLKSQVIVEG
ncbi:DUF3857 domain-containing transglutaminase family protein [Chitinimonas sp. PSY-7]|uniref:DUF3857 domain-containing protein n=1 Tax=Chitinimonas sp. PSY-7 TaxID=3459088 RepID=UPI00403FF682